MRQQFITIEGGEGSGKSTLCAALVEHLKSRNIDVLLTREPGGVPLAESLRSLLLYGGDITVGSEAELLMMYAARVQHLQELILPTLRRGIWVLCDRFSEASFAYQGGGRGVPKGEIERLDHWLVGENVPDLTLLLDLPVETGMSRAKGRGKLDRIEQEGHDFFERVRKAYLQRAAEFPERIKVLDASRPPDKVLEQAITFIAMVRGVE